MSFLHPALLLAGLAISLPVLIHWLTRPRPVRLSLSTVRFVMQAVQQRRARHRLRDWLILLLRTLAIALLVWAFARPLLGQKPLVSAAELGDGVRIVVLDQSASMGAAVHGVTAFEKGRPLTADFLSAGGNLRANLILAGATPRAVFDAPSANVGALREELGRAKPGPERLNLQAAINLAGDMLAKSAPEQRRELVIVSDFQRTNWTTADFSPLPKDTKIELKSVGDSDRANVGILRVSAPGRAEQGRELRVEVEVGNYSTTARDIQVELTIGKGTYRVAGLCPPGLSTAISTTFTPTEPGWQTGQAKLLNVEDSLKADDVRPFALDVRPSPTYLLVTRESAKPQATSSHFTERALAPVVARDGKPAIRVVRVQPSSLDRDAAAGGDLIVLDHPGKLSQPAINLLAGLMRRGRPVLYVAAESADATNLKMLAEAAGAEMKLPVEFLPPAAGQTRRGLFLTEMRKEEVPFSIFGDSLSAALGTLRFAGGLASRRADRGLADDVLASFSDRSAALVVTSCGAGSLGIINADLAASSIPASGAFVPLLSELVSRLMGTRADQTAVNSGEAMAVYLPAEAGAAAGLSLEPVENAGQLNDENAFVTWRWNIAGPPGVYQVKRGNATLFAVATGVSKDESDLRTIDASVIQRLAGGREVHFDAAGAGGGEDQKDRAWTWALIACTTCMLLEIGVLKAFRT
ncbi:MAG: hypothetical protein JWN40_4658 [Phycisphaerales bacterium]|nr:hypothetical protein [Phycisphaerales bacterium]